MSLELILHRINPRQKTQCFKARYLESITEKVSQLNIQTALAIDKIASRFSEKILKSPNICVRPRRKRMGSLSQNEVMNSLVWWFCLDIKTGTEITDFPYLNVAVFIAPYILSWHKHKQAVNHDGSPRHLAAYVLQKKRKKKNLPQKLDV